MDYDTPRRCLPHNLSYPNYIYSERNAPLALSHNTRENPRGYPIGGPVGGMHGRASIEEPMMETGQARRRIAVAVSQQVLRDQSAYFCRNERHNCLLLPRRNFADSQFRLLLILYAVRKVP
jgi:hypothetical protein